ncbi:MAG: isoprenyl transferase [Alphaproteobacteria bacterium]|nr:isoprenyl transferase [Alphaproteobacteria bacterium]
MTNTEEKESKIPTHIAIIMDGNGRWAQEKGLPRTAGHKQGAENVRPILEHAKKSGIKYVTLFAFSSENWNRPKAEVKFLIDLFRRYLNEDIKELQKQKVNVSFVGSRDKFPADIVERMNELERETAGFDDFHVVLALSYGAREDIIAAIKRIALDVKEGKYLISAIDENVVKEALSTRKIPSPDLVIRTSGEQRISNFLLWEIAYAELYFTPIYWPDFNEQDLDIAIEAYGRRERRFGKV